MADEPLLIPVGGAPVPGRRHRRQALSWGALLVVTVPLVAGCSISMPMSSMMPASDDVTGSLATVPFGAILDEEDRRREKAALATALDPQGDGSTIHWENPKTGHKGSVTPVGHAYSDDSKICRAFLSDVVHNAQQRTIQGTACAVTAGDWAMKDGKPFAKA